MNVVVVGAGSLGSLIGGLLAPEHDVTLVGRENDADALRQDGLEISGEVTVHVSPAAATDAPASADLAVVAVKAYDTGGAAATLSDTDLRACLSLQNGLGNEATLAERLDCPVLAGTCTYGARLHEPGHVECTGVGEVALGAREGPDRGERGSSERVGGTEDRERHASQNGGTSAVADEVGGAFADAGIETVVATDMPRRQWAKLAVNAGVNAPTALARVDNGALAEGPAGDVARAAAVEAARVARTEGVDLSGEDAVAALERVLTATAANHSSMRQDVAAGRRTEVDAIYGPVIDRAEGPAPVAATLAALVRGWEAERGLR